MTPDRYRRVLWQGLGRAVVFARTQPDMREYRDAILDACLHCRVFDFDFEGTRSGYIRDVIAELPDRADYEQAVIESLPESGGGRDKLQRQCFVAALAKDGNAQALAALYRHFPAEADEIASLAEQIVYADGMKGFQFVAHRVFALPDRGEIHCFLSDASELLGEEVVEHALRDAGLVKPVWESSSGPRSESPYQFAKRATDADLLQAAEELIAAIDYKDWERTKWYLSVFWDRTFPLDPEPLLKLAQADLEVTNRCSHRAISALQNVTHPAVRALGCERRKGNLILQNFQPGDHRMVWDWYVTEGDEDKSHWMESDLIEIWKQYPQPETEPSMLLSIYEKSGCSLCRERAVERLMELNQLPEQIRAECLWDASDEIRKLVSPVGE